MSIIKRIKQKLKYELGINVLEEENASLLYILNHCIDITKLTPTRDPDLRILQRCDILLLAIFDKLCSKYELDYWLNYGTLLGAYRHQGFIPWDDDIDITMPREHLNKVIPLMKDEIESRGLSISYAPEHPLRCLILGYNAEKTGVWVDLFPVDIYKSGATIEQLTHAMIKYRTFYNKNRHLDAETMTKIKNEIINELPNGDTEFMMSLFEAWMGEPYIIYKPSDIYPIKRAKFENFMFCVPNDMQLITEKRFGKHCMDFPRFAINNHGKSSECTIAQRAKANGIDMNEVYEYLKSIYESL